jgi:amino acid transporter
MIGSPGRGGGGDSPHSGKETFSIDDGSDMPSAGRLGTFFGVFVPCISSMFGVASFLRLSTIVGQAGFWGTFLVIIAGFALCLLTTLSLSALITNGEILGGGMYNAVRNSMGKDWGGVLGLVFYFTYISGMAYSALGFSEVFCFFLGISGDDNPHDVMPWKAPDTWFNVAVASGALLIVTIFALRGAKFSSQISTVMFMFIVLAISSSLVCLVVPTRQNGLFTAFSASTFASNAPSTLKGGESKYSFFGLFILFLPDFTGVVAGCNLSGELTRAADSIPKGSIIAIFVACATYLLIALVQSGSISKSLLQHHHLIMESVPDSVTGIPIAFAAVCCATLNISLNHMVGGSRVLQALGRDEYMPGLSYFEPNHMGTRGEPWRAILMTWFLAQCMIFVGDVDHIAPITSGAFILTFLCINVACFVSSVSSRNFNPKFKGFSRWTAMLGTLLCIIAFIVSASFSSMAVLSVVVGSAVYVKRGKLLGMLQFVASSGDGPKQLPEVEKLLLQSDVQKRVRRAAAYVRDALHGRFEGEWGKEEEDAHRISVKRFFHQLSLLRYLNLAVFLCIGFVERPSWCYNVSCGDPKVVLSSHLPVLPVSVTILIELVCLFGFACEMVLKAAYMSAHAYFGNKWHVAQLVLVLADVASIMVALLAPARMPLMPLIRPLLFVCISRRVRKAVLSLFKIIPSFLDCAVLVTLLIGFFSLFGMLLFQATPEGRQYFPTITDSMLSMFILLTSANFPDVMMPEYQINRLSALFFIAFMLVGVYFFMNLVLATIYHNYRKQCEDNMALFRQRRQDALDVAFQLLDINGTGSLEFSVCQALLVELERPMVSVFDWRTSKVIGLERASNRLSMLGENPTGGINKSMFSELVTNVKLQINSSGSNDNVLNSDADREIAAEACCSLFLGRKAQLTLGKVVRNPRFEQTVDILILVNAILIVIETQYEMSTHSKGIRVLEAVEPVFTLIYVVELALKLVVLGWGEYWRKLRNRFDFFVVVGLVLIEIDMLFSVNRGDYWMWIRYMLLIRLLRCMRLLVAVRRFNVIFATFLQLVSGEDNVGVATTLCSSSALSQHNHSLPFIFSFPQVPAFITLLGMLFALMAFYAEIGVQAFGGKVYVGNPELKSTAFGIRYAHGVWVVAPVWLMVRHGTIAGTITPTISMISPVPW